MNTDASMNVELNGVIPSRAVDQKVAAHEAYAAGLGASEWPAFLTKVPWAKAFPRPEFEVTK